MTSEELIKRLAETAVPVRPLIGPWWQLALWLMPSLAMLALVVSAMGLRADIAERLTEAKFATEVLAASLTGVLAAYAALCSVRPGTRWRQLLLPAMPLLVWLASLGEGCRRVVAAGGIDALSLVPDPICFPAILVTATAPAAGLLVLVRRGAPVMPVVTMALTALAAAALAAAALRLFHRQDASVMVLVWQLGSVVALSAASPLLGRGALRWPSDGLAVASR